MGFGFAEEEEGSGGGEGGERREEEKKGGLGGDGEFECLVEAGGVWPTHKLYIPIQ